jgi:hypothetical protein
METLEQLDLGADSSVVFHPVFETDSFSRP